MDLAELGIVATQKGVKEGTADLDKLNASASRSQSILDAFTGKTREAGTATGTMASQVDLAGASFSAMSGLVLGVVTAVAAFAGAALSVEKFVDATSEAEAMQAQLAAALKSTKGVSGQTIESLNAHAAALQSVTNFGDEAINKSQALLLTFTKIGGDVFPKATEAVLDLAERMGGDLQGATIQVGKALNDPIQGITALSRAGIQFTEDQKKMIAGFVEANDIVSAQTIILKELENQFGGSARAARETLGGAITSLNNAFGDLFEVSGPATTELRKSIEGLITAITDPAFKDFANTIGTVLFRGLELAVNGITLLAEGVGKFWDYAGPRIQQFGDILWQAGSVIIPAVGEAFSKLWDVVSPILTGILDSIGAIIDGLTSLLGLQNQVKAPETATTASTAPLKINVDPLKKAGDDLSNKLGDTLNKGAKTTSTAISSANDNAAKQTIDTAKEASDIGAATLDRAFGVGADAIGGKVTSASSSGADLMGKAIEANATIMAAKFEGTGRNIYDLWNNWGNQFVNSFGTTLGDLLVQFQRAQTEQLKAQSKLLEAQAALTEEQTKYLRDNGQMPGTASSTGSGTADSSGSTSTSTFSSYRMTAKELYDNSPYNPKNRIVGPQESANADNNDDNDKNNKHRRYVDKVANKNSTKVDVSDRTDDVRNKRVQLDERGKVALRIINQNNPRDTLDNLRSVAGERTVINIIANRRNAVNRILGGT